MYATIRGQLTYSCPQYVVVEAGGVGYKIFIPLTLFANLPGIGNELLLYTSHVVREASQALYGFQQMQERELFEQLIAVSGIGPKLGLSIIGHLTFAQLYTAVQQDDAAAIARVPGIGKKMSERMIIDLKDKLPALQFHETAAAFIVPFARDPMAQKVEDAVGALMSLGYTQGSAQKAVKRATQDQDQELDLAALITFSLKCIS